MSFGNGSHVLKRGFLRPNGGSRLPFFLIVGLTIGCIFLLYNLYTTSLNHNSLIDELALTRKKWHTCQRDKTELETRFEAHLKASRTMKEDLERLRNVERSSIDIEKELKQCRDDGTTLQNEIAELKDSKKHEIETCQQQQKELEEKWNICSQAKSALENDIEKLRLVSVAPHVSTTKETMKDQFAAKEQHTVPLSVVEKNPGNVIDSAHMPPPLGLVDTGNESEQQLRKSPIVNQTLHDGKIQSNIMSDNQTLHLSTKSTPSDSSSLHAQPGHQHLPNADPLVKQIQKNGEMTTAAIPSIQVPISDRDGFGTPTPVDDIGTIPVEVKNHNETNSKFLEAPNRQNNAQIDVISIGDKKTLEADLRTSTPASYKRKEKRRRLDKAIEASNPINERQHRPLDQKNDRSRGEQDDFGQQVEQPDVLRPIIPKRISFNENRDHPIRDIDLKTNGMGKSENNFNRGIQGSLDQGNLKDQLDEDGHFSIGPSISDGTNMEIANTPKSISDEPDKLSKLKKENGKLVARKGLKDDYHYKEEDDENEVVATTQKTVDKLAKKAGFDEQKLGVHLSPTDGSKISNIEERAKESRDLLEDKKTQVLDQNQQSSFVGVKPAIMKNENHLDMQDGDKEYGEAGN